MFRYAIQLGLMRATNIMEPKHQKLLADFPVDAETAASKFCLEGKHTIYAVCPHTHCHKTYAPSSSKNSLGLVYPRFCTHREFDGGDECGTRLTRMRVINGVSVEVPVKEFMSFSFKDYVASLTSRPGFESQMDAAWNTQPDSHGSSHDIFTGQFLQDFKGPDGRPFRSDGQAGRYAFSLSVDFFNPFTNKQAGKKVSVGVISLVCLNLPPSMRYKPENMFLAGVIPGPNEPPLTALNHYLTPLMDEMLAFWEPGIKLSKTYNYPMGRLVLCALVAVICDLIAAKKIAGFTSATHEHFCAVCHCTRSKHTYGDTDHQSWKRRTNEECRQSAAAYKAAQTKEEQLKVAEQSGVCWSELLRLPYFDVSRCVVVDSMHNLFLGLIKTHFMKILGIDLSKYREAPILEISLSATPSTFTKNEKKSVAKIKRLLEATKSASFNDDQEKGIKKLMGCHQKALEFCCEEIGLDLPLGSRGKHAHAEALVRWVCFII
jgi:hypothetical protein